MKSITISSNRNALSQELGTKVASALGCQFLGRSSLPEIAQEHSAREADLARVLDPSAYHRLSKRKRALLLSYIQTATLERLSEDSVVCVGLGAHLHVHDVSHVLMIHLLFGARSGVEAPGTSESRATKHLQRERLLRSRWSRACFGVDETDPTIYDMVIRVGQIEQEKLVDVIKDMAGYRKFQPMTYSRLCMSNLLLASRVRSTLLVDYPDVHVEADGDHVIVHTRALWGKQQIAGAIRATVGKMDGVGLVEVHVERKLPFRFPSAG